MRISIASTHILNKSHSIIPLNPTRTLQKAHPPRKLVGWAKGDVISQKKKERNCMGRVGFPTPLLVCNKQKGRRIRLEKGQLESTRLLYDDEDDNDDDADDSCGLLVSWRALVLALKWDSLVLIICQTITWAFSFSSSSLFRFLSCFSFFCWRFFSVRVWTGWQFRKVKRKLSMRLKCYSTKERGES